MPDFPDFLLAHIAAHKNLNNSNYKIDNNKIKDLASKCWDMFSEKEKEHFLEQINNPENKFEKPLLSKLAFDLNRALQSSYDESIKKKTNIDVEISNQVRNFKYLNLSNSTLAKDQGVFQDSRFTNQNFGMSTGAILTALATFPSIEQLGYKEENKEKFIEITSTILKEMISQDSKILDKHGILNPRITAAVAIYVGENFTNLKNKEDKDIAIIASNFKSICSTLKQNPSLEEILEKLNEPTKKNFIQNMKERFTIFSENSASFTANRVSEKNRKSQIR